MNLFKNLFEVAPKEELYITKLTRPLSFWTILLTFIILLFLNSFNIIHTDSLYLEILKSVLMTMTGFYFTARAIEKIASSKYSAVNLNNLDNSSKNIINTATADFNESSQVKKINPDKIAEI